jgi:hypothetical protein
MRERDKNIPQPGRVQPGTVRISLNPGTSAILLLAAAVERKIRAGAGRISMKHFLWPDLRTLPAQVHPSGRAMARVFACRPDSIKRRI